MLVDSHCHLDRLDLSKYDGQLDLALQAAEELGVKHFLCVCIDLTNFSQVIAIAERYKNVQATVGIHPTEVLENEPTVEDIVSLAQHTKVVAIGETGLDYYRCEGEDTEWQRERFRRHIRAARLVQKPLVIHTRQAREDTIKIMREEGAEQVRGVMHCFTEDWAMAQQAMELGFYISFSGIVTFANAKELKALAQKVPLTHMLIETDAPYLAPVPFRGKPNEPAYVRYVAEHIAELKGLPWEDVARATAENFFNLIK